jgi:hypothetical protein
MRAATRPAREYRMSDNQDSKHTGDGTADAIAVTAIITIVVLALYIWLSGMPT